MKTPETKTSQPVTVEELRAKREALEARVAASTTKKADDLARQLSDREALVAEDARFVPLIKEAKQTLKYFETQAKNGILTGEEVESELASLRADVASLEEQREVVLDTYKDLMKNPEVNDAVHDEAIEENKERTAKKDKEIESLVQELKEKSVLVEKRIAEKIKTLGDAMELCLTQTMIARADRDEKYKSHDKIDSEIRDIIIKAAGSTRGETVSFLDNLLNEVRKIRQDTKRATQTYTECFAKAKAYRATLGILQFKDKAALDIILKEENKFTEADKKAKEYNEADSKATLAEEMTDTLPDLVLKYKAIYFEALTEQNKLKEQPPEVLKKFYIYYSTEAGRAIEEDLKKRSGYVSQAGMDDFGKEKRTLDRLNDILLRINKKTTGNKYNFASTPKLEDVSV